MAPNHRNLTNIYTPSSSDKTTITITYDLPSELTSLSLRFLQVSASLENITYIGNLHLKIL